jgi:NTE family protein
MIGAAYAAGNADKLEDWVCSLTKRKLASFFEINLSLNGFVDASYLQIFLDNYVCEESTNIEDLNKTFAAVATELQTGREIWFTEGSVQQAVWSSMALPGLFPPIKYQEKWLVDGALVNPVPVSVCRALGADIVIAVSLNGDIVGRRFNSDKKEKIEKNESHLLSSFSDSVKAYSSSLFDTAKSREEPPPGLFDAVAGSMNIVQDRITRSRMAGDPPDLLLSPRLADIGLMEFQRGREAIKEGEESVLRMSDEINYLLEKIRT